MRRMAVAGNEAIHFHVMKSDKKFKTCEKIVQRPQSQTSTKAINCKRISKSLDGHENLKTLKAEDTTELRSETTPGLIPRTEKRLHYTERKGDLFSCPQSDSLAHCISQDAHMGKGIAAVFKSTFGGVDELLAQGKRPGDVAILRRGQRIIFYLVTKDKYWKKPTYGSLRASLVAMRNICRENNIKALSMPKIGCGLDRLDWSKVSSMITGIFRGEDIKITVYSI